VKVHFIAIGGSVMHQLAIALKRKGYVVTGSDDEIFEPARSNLEGEGLLPLLDGWFPEKIHNELDAIILGMHARADNPELQKAEELKLAIYSFPEYIYQESKDKTRVVVGGSHGKTTTTAMIMNVLKSAGLDFDYLVGARLEGFSQSVNITRAPLIEPPAARGRSVRDLFRGDPSIAEPSLSRSDSGHNITHIVTDTTKHRHANCLVRGVSSLPSVRVGSHGIS